MRSQNDSVALLTVAGIVSCWYSVSVRAVPCPFSRAIHVPPCAGYVVLAVMTPLLALHDVAPDSKPPFCSSCAPVGGVPALLTLKVTGADLPRLPAASVAVAVRLWLPLLKA